jgi:hypothetical protein
MVRKRRVRRVRAPHSRLTSKGKRKGYFGIHRSRPSFLEGMARTLDLTGTLNQLDIPTVEEISGRRATRRKGLEDDVGAIRSYWAAVGQYIRDATGTFEEVRRRANLTSARD